MLAQKMAVWIPLDEVADAWEGVISIFRDYGYRRLRSRARLKFLVADWGAEKFRRILEDEYLHRKLIDGPAPELPARPIDHMGAHRQKDGGYYVGASAIAGRVSGKLLSDLANVPEAHGSDRVRLMSDQTLLVLDVVEQMVGALSDA